MAESYSFPQLQGPKIDISLYPDAATAGINQGNAQLTPTQASVQGEAIAQQNLNASVQGLASVAKTANDVYNQIQDAPIERKARELKNQQLDQQNQILQKQIDSGQSDLEIAAKNADLKARALEANTKVADFDKLNSLAESVAASPTQALSDAQDPATRAALLRDPDKANQILAGFKSAGIPESQYADIQSQVNGAAQLKLDNARKEAELKATRNVAADREKDYSKAQYDVTGALSGTDFGENIDERKIQPSVVKSLTPLEADKYAVKYGDKEKVFDTHEAYNKFIKDKNEVIAYKSANKLYPTVEVGATPAPTPVGGGGGLAAAKPNAAAFVNAAQAAPTANPTPVTQLQDSIPINSNDPITRQKRNELERRAQDDASIRERLLAKGVLKPGIAQPAATPVPGAPTSTPTSTAPPSELPPVSGAPTPIAGEPVPVNTITPAPTATTIPNIALNTQLAHDELPAPIKKIVSVDIAKRVNTNPQLANLMPLYKGLVSVESAGIATAKAKTTTAEGYFQLTDAAAKDVKVDKSKPDQNIAGGIQYMDGLLDRYNKNEPIALMAFYIGKGVIDSAISTAGGADPKDVADALDYMRSRGMFPDQLTPGNIAEAKKFPLKVLAYKRLYENA